MSCPKNPNKTFFGLFEGPHDWKEIYISAMLTPDYYEMHRECSYCGCNERDFFIKESDLVKKGYDPRKLQELDGYKYFSGAEPVDLK